MGILASFKQDLMFYLSRRINKPLVKPDYFMISLTDECNLRCKMCGCLETAQKYKGRELTTHEIKDLINQMEKWANSAEVTFSGGEPFVRKDILDLIGYVSSKHLTLSINTNGTLINKEIADKLASYPVYHLNFSLDGDSAEINDSVRGKGSFLKVLQSIELLNEAKIRHKSSYPVISLNFTIMKQNIGGIANIIPLAKQYKVQNVFFQPVITDNTDYQKVNEYIFLEKAELDMLINILKSIGLQAKENQIHTEIPSLPLLRDYFSVKTNNISQRQWKCFVGYNRISISSFGQVCSCFKENFGEIRNNSLKEIWYSPTASRIRKEFKKCKKFCLQTCYARPDSESLFKVVKALFKKDNKCGIPAS